MKYSTLKSCTRFVTAESRGGRKLTQGQRLRPPVLALDTYHSKMQAVSRTAIRAAARAASTTQVRSYSLLSSAVKVAVAAPRSASLIVSFCCSFFPPVQSDCVSSPALTRHGFLVLPWSQDYRLCWNQGDRLRVSPHHPTNSPPKKIPVLFFFLPTPLEIIGLYRFFLTPFSLNLFLLFSSSSYLRRADWPLPKLQAYFKDDTLALIGYGSQGHGQGLNARDNGLNVIVGVREGGESWKQAQEDGWVSLIALAFFFWAGKISFRTPVAYRSRVGERWERFRRRESRLANGFSLFGFLCI